MMTMIMQTIMTRMTQIAKNYLKEFKGPESFSSNPVWGIVDVQYQTPLVADSIFDSFF